jgi:predicted nucleotidyltransferase
MGDALAPAALALARRVAGRLAADPAVEAVALAGSRAGPLAEPGSDLDLYVYAPQEPARALRAAAAEGGLGLELGNRFFEPGDEWLDAASGLGVDVMYRTPAWIEAQLERVLVRHEPSVGYSTAVWHGVRVSVPLLDRRGWFAALQARARAPYPEPLRRAVVAHNQPLLRRTRSSYLHQLERAAARGDGVAVNHRAAAFLASAFDVLFAVNRATHPGEKRLLAHAAASCPRRPPGLDALVGALLAAVPGPEVVAAADALGEAVDRLLADEGLLP